MRLYDWENLCSGFCDLVKADGDPIRTGNVVMIVMYSIQTGLMVIA